MNTRGRIIINCTGLTMNYAHETGKNGPLRLNYAHLGETNAPARENIAHLSK